MTLAHLPLRTRGTPSRTPRLTAAAALLACLTCVAPRAALAAVDCSTLPSPIYGIGGSAHKPLIARFAGALAATNAAYTVVYQAPGACVCINTLIGNTKLAGGSTASYWDAAGKEQQCTIPLAGVSATWGNMGNTATSCPGIASLPTHIGDFPGSVSTVNFIVPNASTQQSISAEAAYFVYGFGAAGRVSPWVDETVLGRRDANSYVTTFLSIALHIPPGSFKGVDTKSNTGTVSLLSTAATPEAAVGAVSGDVADANRASVRTLAYQHFGQSCGYWPDSTSTAFDKINVREGQYYFWSPTHFFSYVDANGKITDASTAAFIDLVTGKTPVAGIDTLSLQIQSGTVPQCAMHVRRDGDLTPIQSFQPAAPCVCTFEKIATGATACKACQTNADCGAGACRNSYCEVQ